VKNSKYMDDYNFHDWAKFRVRKSEDKPTGPHFAAVLLDTRTELSPSYEDRPGNGYDSNTVPDVTYFAFPDQETLSEWALRASKDKKHFFCFEVKKLATVELKVSIDVGL
jgi:hypothetical protein